jgi:hypothetical protein
MTGDKIVPLWKEFWHQAHPIRSECSLCELERMAIAARLWVRSVEHAIDERKSALDQRRQRREQRRAAA